MTMLTALRGRFSTREPSTAQPGGPPGDAVAGTELPFEGYDSLNGKQVAEGLFRRSQVELEAVESYERSHQDRQRVLNKLGYMRGSEPLPGYDALSVEEIATALADADMQTIKKVRGYERKFANRVDVLEELARVQDVRRDAEPRSAPPAYQPMTVTSGASRLTAAVEHPAGRLEKKAP